MEACCHLDGRILGNDAGATARSVKQSTVNRALPQHLGQHTTIVVTDDCIGDAQALHVACDGAKSQRVHFVCKYGPSVAHQGRNVGRLATCVPGQPPSVCYCCIGHCHDILVGILTVLAGHDVTRGEAQNHELGVTKAWTLRAFGGWRQCSIHHLVQQLHRQFALPPAAQGQSQAGMMTLPGACSGLPCTLE